MSAEPADAWTVLDWDSEFFGFRIARATAAPSAEALARTLQECARQEVRCLYFLADAGDFGTIRLLEDHGFRFADLRATLIRQAPGLSEIPGVRRARPEDLPALRAIARVSHRNSRFYVDSNFPRDRCDALYDTWITKSVVEGFADAVFVSATTSGEASGYITCSMIRPDRGQIGLLAVAPEQRGTGAGRKLIERALSWAREQGAASVITVTQGGSISAVRAYERCGFVADSMQLWYHRWWGVL